MHHHAGHANNNKLTQRRWTFSILREIAFASHSRPTMAGMSDMRCSYKESLKTHTPFGRFVILCLILRRCIQDQYATSFNHAIISIQSSRLCCRNTRSAGSTLCQTKASPGLISKACVYSQFSAVSICLSRIEQNPLTHFPSCEISCMVH